MCSKKSKHSSNSETLQKISSFPDEVLEKVLGFLESHKDRSSVSLVCKDWYNAERWSRTHIFIGNCYAVTPEIVARRFPKIRSVILKGKPRFSDFNLVPEDWGAYIHPWLLFFAKVYPFLEELRLKRMRVSDESLEFLSLSFPNFKRISLLSCDGFSTDGLAAIASNCKYDTFSFSFLVSFICHLGFSRWVIFILLIAFCVLVINIRYEC